MTRLALHLLFFLSGAAALGYQLVWAKMFSTGLGHEMPAVLAIIAAFMAGMALGAAWLDRFIPREVCAGRWLAGLELTIGVWAVIASFAIPHANEWALQLIGLAPNAGKHWLIAFAVPAFVLLPATVAVGATFPAMEKFLSAVAPRNESIGSVYAANTFGAVAGTLLAPFVLMPALGFSKSCWVLAGLNLVVAIGATALAHAQGERMPGSAGILPARSEATRQQDAGTPKKHADSAVRAPLSYRRIAGALFLTGLLGIAYETAGVRVLLQVLEGTVFTYAAVLAVFLLGTAAGAAAFHRWGRGFEPVKLLTNLLCLTAAACLLSIGVMAQTPMIYRLARGLGGSTAAVLSAELITALAVFALPTFLMGALFSHLVPLARTQRGRIGNVIAANTLGAALGPAFTLLLLPLMGCKLALAIIGAGYFALGLKLPRSRLALVPLVALAVALSTNFTLVKVPPGGKILSQREGVMASVAIVADTNDQRTLRVDNRYQMGGTAASDAEYRQAHLPLLLHANPQRALFLGVGTGISLGAASLYPRLQADGVELVPEVLDVMTAFESKNFSPARQPNLKLHVADARRFVRVHQAGPGYNVIVADLFHPYRDGAGALYTREHFAAIRQQLDPNTPSLFCQWLPLHQLDERTLRVIVRTFQSVFPNCDAWLLRFNVDVPVIALTGWMGTPRWSPTQVESRLGEPRLAGELKRLAIADSLRLHGHLLADREDLNRFAGTAPLNTDDNQRITFMAPRAAYQHDAKTYASMLALLANTRTESITALDRFPSDEKEFAARLTHYLAARNVYLHGLIHDAEQRQDEAIGAYLESTRLSPDFTSGYAQCLTIANVIAPSNPARARRILEQLMEAQPDRPAAAELLRRLFTP